MDIEERLTKLERAAAEEDKIGRAERVGIRVGMLIIVLLTLALIIVTKFSEVCHAIQVALQNF